MTRQKGDYDIQNALLNYVVFFKLVFIVSFIRMCDYLERA